jgi:hypothetical protein
MNAMRFFILGLVAIGLAACASPQPAGKPPVLDKLRAMGIDPSTYTKIANNRVLSYDDIYGLVKKGVPGPVIVTYLQSTRAPYQLTDAQLVRLVNAGASSDLVNYLGKSVGFFEATERNQTGTVGKWKHHPFYEDPFFLGPAPFDYAWPPEWYDAGWVGAYF